MSTVIGIISDTHGLLRPEAIAALTGSDLILHAGDIGKPEVLKSLKAIAPVYAIRGNNDTGDWATKIPEDRTVKINAVSVYMIHDLKEMNLTGWKKMPNIVVSGHSHKPSILNKGGVLFINPGSAGPRRFKLPVAVAILRIDQTNIDAKIIELSI